MKLRFAPAARREMFDKAAWYGARRKELEHEFLDEIGLTVRLLQQFPLAGRIVRPNARVLRVNWFPFNLYDRVLATEIIVLAVAHHKTTVLLAKAANRLKLGDLSGWPGIN